MHIKFFNSDWEDVSNTVSLVIKQFEVELGITHVNAGLYDKDGDLCFICHKTTLRLLDEVLSHDVLHLLDLYQYRVVKSSVYKEMLETRKEEAHIILGCKSCPKLCNEKKIDQED